MTSFHDDDLSDGLVVYRKASPPDVPPQLDEQQGKGWLRWLGALLGICNRYTASDLSRLKEAGVRTVEANADEKAALAKLKVAEAAKLHAETEVIKQQAAIARGIAEIALCDAQAMRAQAVADSIERVEAAISKIRQNGGDVVFDSKQLEQILGSNGAMAFEADDNATK